MKLLQGDGISGASRRPLDPSSLPLHLLMGQRMLSHPELVWSPSTLLPALWGTDIHIPQQDPVCPLDREGSSCPRQEQIHFCVSDVHAQVLAVRLQGGLCEKRLELPLVGHSLFQLLPAGSKRGMSYSFYIFLFLRLNEPIFSSVAGFLVDENVAASLALSPGAGRGAAAEASPAPRWVGRSCLRYYRGGAENKQRKETGLERMEKKV